MDWKEPNYNTDAWVEIKQIKLVLGCNIHSSKSLAFRLQWTQILIKTNT
jgi:hypothetical protein